MKTSIRAVAVLSLSAALAACAGGGDEVIVEQPAGGGGSSAAAVAATATPTPTPEETPSEESSYNPIGKRDPFKSFLAEELAPGQQRALTPLQRYDIDQMQLIGIIWGISAPRAMVITPDGKGYVVQKGTLIGKNWGKVSRITQDEVIISEEFRDFEGKLIVHEIPLKMPKPEAALE